MKELSLPSAINPTPVPTPSTNNYAPKMGPKSRKPAFEGVGNRLLGMNYKRRCKPNGCHLFARTKACNTYSSSSSHKGNKGWGTIPLLYSSLFTRRTSWLVLQASSQHQGWAWTAHSFFHNRYVGRLYVKVYSKPMDIMPRLNELAGFLVDEELEYFDIRYHPSNCKRVNKDVMFYVNKSWDGDIIYFQKALKVGRGEEFRYPNIRSYIGSLYQLPKERYGGF
ncbi:hypothetical protein RIF29_21330 [Crotalaria pallida]|uniref:Ubiquitin carboxyl-terminal hydrolase 7 ICP0-binding domain-containing protein n=1 Tax=Crotalaria pallida TaxID=3830 RepID=A0AAN9I5V1_CROPI